jgi:excinuclease ABC subunit C
MQVAMENARDTLRAMDSLNTAHTDVGGAVSDLSAALDLPRLPARIECFDISTLQGTNTVGSMVVFVDGTPARSEYRRFRIRSAARDDDFACLEEVLTRRFTRLERYRAAGTAGEGPVTAFETTPDLVIIDGGKGQLAVAVSVLSRLGLDDVPLAALAKRNEELYRPGRPSPVRLPADSPTLHLVQRLRDEAHRFAVSYHRSLRRSEGMASSLDEIPGIGSRRRRALLSAFGSLDAIRAASVEELAAVPTMTRSMAEKVKALL